MPKCETCGKEMICPSCRAAEGGKARAKKYSKKQLRAWGAKGGRKKKEK